MARLELLSVPVELQCPGYQVVQAMLEHLSPRRSGRLTLGGKQMVGVFVGVMLDETRPS